MHMIISKLGEGSERLKASGAVFAGRTREAGADLLQSTREAATGFRLETSEAAQDLVHQSRELGAELLSELREEVGGVGARIRHRLPSGSAGEGSGLALRHAVSVSKLEIELLEGLRDALRKLEGALEHRIEVLAEHEPASSLEARVARAGRKASQTVVEAGRGVVSKAKRAASSEPLSGYDAMTAKEVLHAVSALGAKELEAVRKYEKANKARATVLKAVTPRG